MATNNFLPFCPTNTGTNLLSQADYAASPFLPIGNQPGVASSQLNNKVLRQASTIAAEIAQAVSDILNLDMLDTDGNESVILAQIKQAFQSPVGSVVAFGGSSAPIGWHLCDGSSQLRAGTYAALFAIIGTTYGSADGTHFNLPDLRGIFIRGAGTNGTLSNANATPFAGVLGTYQNDKFQGHYHTLTDPGHTHGIQCYQGTIGGGGGIAAEAALTAPLTVGTNSSGTGATVVAALADGTNGTPRTGLETNPANLGMNYIIKI